jgi:hypothetical protein
MWVPVTQEEIIAWLRTPEGERWNQSVLQEGRASGLFASVKEDGTDLMRENSEAVRWPEPYPCYDLDLMDRLFST